VNCTSPIPRIAVTTAILAGGAGSRLGGRDKGLVELNGRPLVAHVRASLPPAAVVLIIANRNRAAYTQFGCVIGDLDNGARGPMAGIVTALTFAESEWVATLPVDCPQPPSDLALRLAQPLTGHSQKLAVAHDGIRRQPLFALYHRSLAESARAALERDMPVWRWQDENHGVEVDFSDVAAAFDNLNTEQDFAVWRERMRTAKCPD
jgi:molybdopterin-guanine dinucleotide biosynthesis protein A